MTIISSIAVATDFSPGAKVFYASLRSNAIATTKSWQSGKSKLCSVCHSGLCVGEQTPTIQ